MLPLVWAFLPFLALVSAQWIEYPDFGVATLTHYTLPSGFVAACGCTPASTGFPTAALSQMAYGSSTAYGAPLPLYPLVISLTCCVLRP